MNVRCITIDDEPLALEKLHTFLKKIPYVELVESFTNCIEALPAITALKPDILFLDIEMEHITGIQMLEKVAIKPRVIIISAYEKYAIKGYELNVSDYILKPYSFDRLLKAVEKVRQQLLAQQSEKETVQTDYIFIKTDTRIVKILKTDIKYIEGMRDYLCIHTIDGRILTLLTFPQLLELLPTRAFVRVHKSYAVHLKHIDAVEKHRIHMGDTRIPVSLTYRDEFYAKLEK